MRDSTGDRSPKTPLAWSSKEQSFITGRRRGVLESFSFLRHSSTDRARVSVMNRLLTICTRRRTPGTSNTIELEYS